MANASETAPAIYTLGELIKTGADTFAGRDAIVFPHRRLSYTDLNAGARRWAKALIARGVKPGQNVGILLSTCPDFMEIFFGIAMAGAVSVPLNARYQAGELAFVLRDADIVALITTGSISDSVNFEERLLSALPSLAGVKDENNLNLPEVPKLKCIISLADQTSRTHSVDVKSALAAGAAIPDKAVDDTIAAVDRASIALILYTSGTTANPKGCMIPHRAIIGTSRNLGKRYEVTSADKVWSPLPIFHIAGIMPMVMLLDVGGAYLTVQYFDAGTALEMLGREGATIAYPSFVTIMRDLIGHPTFKNTDLSKLRIMNSNFAVQPAWIKDAMVAAMPHVTHVGTYGLSECSGTVTTSRLTDSFEARTCRLGVPLDEVEVKLIDENGKEVERGHKGEILVRGPNVLKGYYNAPEKTAQVIDAEGWVHTGDIGSFDAEGTMMFHGRTKDMMKVGGENVAAAEVEAVLQTHPAVKLAQVVGIPDDRYEEVPAAFIELVSGHSVNETDLIKHCTGKLSNFKLPRYVRFITDWPMSASKIQKYRLRTTLVDELKQSSAARP